jgi:hypothetical protein
MRAKLGVNDIPTFATYPPCPFDGNTEWRATSHAVVTMIGNGRYIKQEHACTVCRSRARLGRMISDPQWNFGVNVFR